MAGRFALDISAWVAKAKGNADQVVRKIDLDVATSVIMGTPVRTGRARANWFPSIGTPSDAVGDQVDRSGSATVERANALIAQQQGGHVFYLTNNVPYIVPLEQGSSKQAPAGMVMVTVRRFQALADAAAAVVR
jgi:hypothetical protein